MEEAFGVEGNKLDKYLRVVFLFLEVKDRWEVFARKRLPFFF